MALKAKESIRERAIVNEALGRALSGAGAHAGTADVFAALDWKHAGVRPANAPHSVYELLHHMIFWQEWVLSWLDGRRPRIPRHAAGSWTRRRGPSNRREWTATVRRFRQGLKALTRRAREADLFSGDDRRSRLDMLHTIASHNSYHAGQVVLLRQLLDDWPPPSGGLTW
jgi:uncharacterized damage-inducible protein DinB